MDNIRALTNKLGEALQNEPLSCCCVPYHQNLPAVPAPRVGAITGQRLPLYTTGMRVMGQLPVNLELYPGPSRPVPQLKAELRGGRHYPACSCVKRNGLQDSCLSWRCMQPLNARGCGSLPFPTCGLGRRQLARYAALPDRTPEHCRYDAPPCDPASPASPRARSPGRDWDRV